MMVIVELLSRPSTLGFPQLLIRELAVYKSKNQWGFIKGILKLSTISTFFISLIISLCAGFIAWIIWGANEPNTILTTFYIALFALPLAVSMQILANSCRGLGYIIASQVPIAVVKPCLFIGFIGIFSYTATGSLTADQALLSQIGATFISIIIFGFILKKIIPRQANLCDANYQTSIWLKSAWPFFIMSGIHLINYQTDILMLGFFETADSVGIYRISQRGAMLVPFVFMALNTAIAPTISSLFANGELRRLNRLLVISARWVLVSTLPIVIILTFCGSFILRVVYGEEFESAATSLSILSVAHLITICMGFGFLSLNMSGYERTSLKIFTFSAVLNVVLNLIFIPLYGYNGAALATGVSMALNSFILAIILNKKLKLKITAFNKVNIS